MRITHHFSRTLAVCAIVLLSSAACAAAAPITVQLRVEGSSKTLFEGPVSTEGESFSTESSKGEHPCNYHENGPQGGFEDEGVTSGTPTTALHDAALAGGLAFNAKWFGSGKEENENPGDFFVTQVGPDINQSSGEFAAWGFAVNYTTSNVGGCQIALAPGSEVLWAYNYFNLSHRLKLTAPASAGLGVPFTVKVVDGGTGAPVAGATIGQDVAGVTTPLAGSPTTNSSGEASVSLASTGVPVLKATAPESVRSNGATVCVHNGEDGTCSTTKPVTAGPGPLRVVPAVTPATAQSLGLLAGHVYSRRSAPRLLRGVVHPGTEAVKDVRISLQRRVGKRCFTFSGTRGRFVHVRCGRASFFSVGDSLSFSYLLPSRLPAGRYSFAVEAITGAGTARASHVTFRVL